MKLIISPPERLHKPLEVPKRLQLTPGPSNLHEQVRKVMSLSMIGELDEEFLEIMDDVKAGLYSLFKIEMIAEYDYPAHY